MNVLADLPGLFESGHLLGFSGDTIAQNIRAFLGPLVLIGIAIIAVYYLLIVKQPIRFFQWALLALVAGVFFYRPEVVQRAATTLSTWFG